MARKRTQRSRQVAPEPAAASSSQPVDRVVFERFVGNLLWLWGNNGFGQLGLGDEFMELVAPTLSKFTQKVKEVAVGAMHTLVLLEDGTLWSFGVNDEGALGRETEVDENEEPVEGKDATRPGEVKLPEEGIKQLACSDNGSFVVMESGSIYGWGTFRNEHGVLGFSDKVKRQLVPEKIYTPTARNAPAVQIAAGGNHVVAVLTDGRAISWGDGDQGQLGRISLRNSRRSSVRTRNMLRPTKIPGCKNFKFVEVSCGEYSTFLRTDNGHFFAFGLNNCGQLAISPKENLTNEDTLTLEGRVNNWVTMLSPTFVQFLEDAKIMTVAPGKDHGLGINEAGCLYSWGVPTYGVLGREDVMDEVNETTPYPKPAPVSGLEGKTIVDIASGQVMSGCIDSAGDLYTWGAALNDMLGYPCDDDVLVPRKVPKNKRRQSNHHFTNIVIGGQHCAMLGA